jgi:hypothetical protein
MLVASRCFVEAVTFTALAAIVHAMTAGRGAMPVSPTVLVLFGVGLLLVSVMREIQSERTSTVVLVISLAAAVAWGFILPTRNADGFALLSRAVLFGILGESYLWRILSIARGATRWTDARNAAPFAGLAIALAVLLPLAVDRAAFAPLALIVVAAAGLALSLARTTEELALSRGTTGTARASSATSATVVLGAVAIVAAALMPAVQDLLGAFGTFIGPIVGRILYLLILPFAYLAGALIEWLRPLLANRPLPSPPALFSPLPPEQEEELLRQIEQSRPYLFGFVELVIAAIAVLVAIVLLDRMLRERRLDLPEGVTLEREGTTGIGLMDAFRGLRPRMPARRRPPIDDGTSAAAIRLLYWRFLSLAERHGPGWRARDETPTEHASRAASQGAMWREAEPIVRAFEDVRYGELRPQEVTVIRAREALASLERSVRES